MLNNDEIKFTLYFIVAFWEEKIKFERGVGLRDSMPWEIVNRVTEIADIWQRTIISHVILYEKNAENIKKKKYVELLIINSQIDNIIFYITVYAFSNEDF